MVGVYESLDKHVWAWIIGGLCAFLACVISAIEMINHCKYNHDPVLRRHVLRILFMVPLYAFDAYFGLLMKDHTEYWDLARESYEAVVIYSFYEFLVAYIGGAQRLVYLATVPEDQVEQTTSSPTSPTTLMISSSSVSNARGLSPLPDNTVASIHPSTLSSASSLTTPLPIKRESDTGSSSSTALSSSSSSSSSSSFSPIVVVAAASGTHGDHDSTKSYVPPSLTHSPKLTASAFPLASHSTFTTTSSTILTSTHSSISSVSSSLASPHSQPSRPGTNESATAAVLAILANDEAASLTLNVTTSTYSDPATAREAQDQGLKVDEKVSKSANGHDEATLPPVAPLVTEDIPKAKMNGYGRLEDRDNDDDKGSKEKDQGDHDKAGETGVGSEDGKGRGTEEKKDEDSAIDSTLPPDTPAEADAVVHTYENIAHDPYLTAEELKQHPREHYHMLPCRWCCRRPITPAQFVRITKYGALQYVPIQLFTCSMAFILTLAGTGYIYGDFSLANAYPYLAFMTNMSQIWAMYCLFWFYAAYHAQLAPCRPLWKAACIKGIVFFTFWQSVLINLWSYFYPVDCDEHFRPDSDRRICTEEDYNNEQRGRAIQDFIICIEMLLFAVVHMRVFSYKEFRYRPGSDDRPLFRRVVTFFNPGDMIRDVKHMVKGGPKPTRIQVSQRVQVVLSTDAHGNVLSMTSTSSSAAISASSSPSSSLSHRPHVDVTTGTLASFPQLSRPSAASASISSSSTSPPAATSLPFTPLPSRTVVSPPTTSLNSPS